MHLTTRETEHLLAEYPEIEYLEAGHIGDWLITRKEQLLVLAKEERIGSSLAKSAGLVVTFTGFLFHASSPLAPIGLLAGITGYLIAQLKDSEQTHTFNPIPFIRGGVLEVFGSLGNSELRNDFLDNYDEFDRLKGYLSPTERQEYQILRENSGLLAEILAQVEGGKRFYLYRWLVDQYTLLRGSLPHPETIQAHIQHLPLSSPLINQTRLHQIEEATKPNQPFPSKPLCADLPKPDFQELPQDSKTTPLESIPLKQRAEEVVKLLVQAGFKIDQILSSQITAIAGGQRGGKGTLAGILTILSCAYDPHLRCEYYTSGADIYPFKCELKSALNYPSGSAEEADKHVASQLVKRLSELEQATPYSQSSTLLVIDEAMRLFSLMEEQTRIWAITFLLTRFAKTGAGLILVLHSNNLSSVVGSRNTSGLAATFKDGVNFIGCTSQQVKTGLLTSTAVASGKYFRANPNNFAQPLRGGELGEIPEWLKSEMNPLNNQPDPVRTMLKLFPELEQQHQEPPRKDIEDVRNLEYALHLEDKKPIVNQELLDSIYFDKLAETTGFVSFDAIRSHVQRHLPHLRKNELISAVLDSLIKQQAIEGDRKRGYRII